MTMRPYFLLLPALACGLGACENNHAFVRMKIEATDSQGKTVADAQIFVNGAAVGTTNGKGVFTGETELDRNARLELKVTKESGQFYFAPFYDTLLTNDERIQVVNRKAMLYSVPKPSMEEADKVPVAAGAPTPEAGAAIPATTVAEEAMGEGAPQGTAENLSQQEGPQHDEGQAVAKPAAASATDVEKAQGPASLAEEPAHNEIVAPNHPNAQPLAEATTSTAAIAAKKDDIIYHVHVFGEKQPLAGVTVSYGFAEQGQLRAGCKTTEQGRCFITFPTLPHGPVTFVVKQSGYLTKSHTVTVRPNGNLKFALQKGETVDVFALTKTFQYVRGIANAKVTIQGKPAGATDQFGHLAYTYGGQKSDLIEVGIEAKNYLPGNFSTDFVVAGPMNLIKYFAPPEAPRARIAVVKARSAGDTSDVRQLAFFDKAARDLGQALVAELGEVSSLALVPSERVEEAAHQAGSTPSRLIQGGWWQNDLKADVDAIIQPTLVLGEAPALEISAINNEGRVIAAANRQFAKAPDAKALRKIAHELTQRLLQSFPFEAAVANVENNRVTINIGKGSARGLRGGELVEIYGTQADKYGAVQSQEKIAKVKIDRLAADTASGAVVHLAPRATIEKGDIVLLREREPVAAKAKGLSLNVRDKDGAVGQANIYLDNEWLGATDPDGVAYLNHALSGRKGHLTVLKHGYTEFSKDMRLDANDAETITMERAAAFLRIDSEPSGALVKVDGKVLGKTPITSPIAVPSGFITLEVEGPDEFKKHHAVLEMDNGTLDLTGHRAIVLERDLRREAKRWLDQNKVDEAIAKYEAIPPQHSDYLLAQHELGELYLSLLKDPEKAAAAFARVTARAEVRDFSDKRFIGSHINQGIALCQWAEKIQDSDEKGATEHLAEAISIFERVTPYLHYIDGSQAAQAVHNVAYHKALATHTLWQLSGNRQYLDAAIKDWTDYIEDKARQYPLAKGGINYVESAETYLRQAKAVQVTAPRL